VAGVRTAIRVGRELDQGYATTEETAALIVGAGDAGEMLLREIERSNGLDYDVVGFLDDDPSMLHKRIRGVPVLGTLEDLPEVCTSRYVKEVLVALPSASEETRRGIVQLCHQCGVPSKTVPNLRDLLEGKAQIGQLKEVLPEDLLGRSVVRLDTGRLRKEIRGKSILVTGAAGSIGSELCRQIAVFEPERIVLLDRLESGLYHMENQLRARHDDRGS
jgi:FlaA1/EpsC-like NDP-sugar epimerase